MMSKPLDTDRAWAAGFFDGEGCTFMGTSHSNNRTRHFLVMSVGQKDRRALLKLLRVMGVGNVYGPFSCNQSYYKVTGTKVIRALKVIWPWLGPVKRDQAVAAIRKWRASYAYK